MRKQNKKYSRPHRPFDKARIEEENILKEKYGLKNKKEIWKADAAVSRIRNLAKRLITANVEDKQAFIDKLKKKGFKIESISDALALNKQDWLKRRLQTIVFSKKLSNTPKQARQLITHKHVSIGNKIVNIPSYQVDLDEEGQVQLNIALKIKEEKKSKFEKIKEEILEEDVFIKEDAEEGKEINKSMEVKV